MNELAQFFNGLSKMQAETFGVQAFYALLALLAAIDRQWGTAFLSNFDQHKAGIRAHLHANPALTCALRRYFEAYRDALLDDDVLDDPTALADFNTLIAFLAEDYPAALPEPARTQSQQAFEQLQPQAAASLVSATLPQALVLADAVAKVTEFLASRSTSPGRAILLDFPVGNSLPTRVVERILMRERIPVEVVRVALTRNDSRSRGVTRREILEARLAERGVQAADTVVLLDEWLTGSNFRNVVELLERIPAIREATFLPVGLLTETSSAEERSASHVWEHDDVIRRLGEDGTAYRFVFPALASRFPRNGYFFWSEHDRLAGFRKSQTFGAYLSALEAAIDRIRTDPTARRRARQKVVAQIAADPQFAGADPAITAGLLADGGELDKQFEESCEDYEQCKAEIHRIEPATARGADANVEAELKEVVARLHEIVDPRPAKVCVLMALFLMESEQEFDAPNPYYLAGHAPAVCELGGSFARMSGYVVDELVAVMMNRT